MPWSRAVGFEDKGFSDMDRFGSLGFAGFAATHAPVPQHRLPRLRKTGNPTRSWSSCTAASFQERGNHSRSSAGFLHATRRMTLLASIGFPCLLAPSQVEHCGAAGQRYAGYIRPGMGAPLPPSATSTTEASADLALVRAALAGKPAAREQLADRLACLPAMIRLKHQRMGAPLGPHELDDVVQNVLLVLWRKLERFDGRVPVARWAFGFGVLEILKMVERRARRREQVGDLPELATPAANAPPAATERLARLCGELPPLDQEILRQKHFEDRTFEDIAARTGVRANTIKTRYYRVLERLRRRLGPGEVVE